jgi:hypothetical protein
VVFLLPDKYKQNSFALGISAIGPKMRVHLVLPDTYYFPALKVGLRPPGFESGTTELDNYQSELLPIHLG